MAKYNVTANTTMTAEKTRAKAELMSVIENALKAHYDEDVVMWVRSTGSSPKNEIGVVVGDIADGGYEYDMTFTVDCTCKPYKDGKRGKSIVEAYDIYEANAEYEAYLTDKATKKAEAEARKAERKVSGSKSKTEKAKTLAEAQTRLDAVGVEVAERQRAEAEAKRYRVEVDGETVAENLTLKEATAKRGELTDSGTVKIYEMRG